MLVTQITHPNYEHVVEIQKGAEELTSSKCCFQVNNEVSDLEKPTDDSITPRGVKMHVPNHGERNHNESQPISLEKHAQLNGFVKFLFNLHQKVNPSKKDELRAHNEKGS